MKWGFVAASMHHVTAADVDVVSDAAKLSTQSQHAAIEP
jgi:hypothetical protein